MPAVVTRSSASASPEEPTRPFRLVSAPTRPPRPAPGPAARSALFHVNGAWRRVHFWNGVGPEPAGMPADVIPSEDGIGCFWWGPA